MRPIVLRHEARADLLDAAEWYEQRSKGMGRGWFQAVDATLLRLSEHPEGPAILYENIRRWAIRKFPFGVFYRIRDDRIEVLAVLHGRRHTRTLKTRLRDEEL
jgi:toxin ParE1/3/4